MKRAYDRIVNERYRETDEVDIARAYEIIEAFTAHPDRKGPTRAYTQMPCDSMEPMGDSGISMQLLHKPIAWQQEMLPLRVETCNANCWSSAKTLIERTSAHVLCIQEHRLVHDIGIENARRWCTSMGWHAVFEAAQRTTKGGASAGVAILVREWIGLLGAPQPDHNVLARHRAIVGLINLPGSPYVITVVSIYLHDSEGLTSRNRKILTSVGSEIRILAHPYVIAGDFNTAPEVLCKECKMLNDITGES